MRWYVLRSKPNREQALWLELDAHGVETYYPYLTVKPVNPRSRKMRPYFPGYLFVRVKLMDVGQSRFTWLPHSQGLVCFDGEPAPVPEELVNAIRKRVDEIQAAGGEQMLGLEHGETVIIQAGPFAGYKAIFDARIAGDERVRVLLQLLKTQQLKVELPAEQIRRASPR